MSRCSLQLYVNENFTFSRPSLASSDDFLKNLSTSDWKRSSFATSHTDKEVLQKLNRLKTKNCLAKTLNDNYEEYHPILTSYLLRHTKSVEAYRRIRKQQEEILSLCRKKLAKKLSGSFLSGIRDEDIIRALRLIQDTELQLNEPHHSDTLIHSVLQGIISDDGKWSSKSDQNDNQTSTEDPLLRHLPQNFAYSSSALPKRRKRYNLVFKKLKGFFKKPRSIASTFTLTSKFTGQISTGNTFFRCPTKLFGPIEKELIYPYHIGTSPQDYKIYASSAYEKAPRQLHIGMGSKSTCACHRNLLKLQNEFVKQQSEIRLINQNLEQCLCILHDIGDKPQTTHASPYDSPAKNDIYVYSACPHSGPYGDRYYERSPDPNNYQILACRKASPKESQSSAKKDPKKKGGCCRRRVSRRRKRKPGIYWTSSLLLPAQMYSLGTNMSRHLVSKGAHTEQEQGTTTEALSTPGLDVSLPPDSLFADAGIHAMPNPVKHVVLQTLPSTTTTMTQLNKIEKKSSQSSTVSKTTLKREKREVNRKQTVAMTSTSDATDTSSLIPTRKKGRRSCCRKKKKKIPCRHCRKYCTPYQTPTSEEPLTVLPPPKQKRRRSCLIRFCRYLLCSDCCM